jgi:integrase
LVLVATFGSLRWGEVTALRRCDVDTESGIVQVRAALAERSSGELIRGLPKSAAGVRSVTLPRPVRLLLAAHLAGFTEDGSESLIFTGDKGAALRRSNFNRRQVARERSEDRRCRSAFPRLAAYRESPGGQGGRLTA